MVAPAAVSPWAAVANKFMNHSPDLVSEMMLHGKTAAMPCPAWRQFLIECLLLVLTLLLALAAVSGVVWLGLWASKK